MASQIALLFTYILVDHVLELERLMLSNIPRRTLWSSNDSPHPVSVHPVTFALKWFASEQTIILFLCSLVALIPASMYIERPTEHISEYAGESIGGLLNTTLGNMPKLFIGWAPLNMG